nr:murein biosynthesis integral membrane protein MurJ [Nocardia flavorosea]
MPPQQQRPEPGNTPGGPPSEPFPAQRMRPVQQNRAPERPPHPADRQHPAPAPNPGAPGPQRQPNRPGPQAPPGGNSRPQTPPRRQAPPSQPLRQVPPAREPQRAAPTPVPAAGGNRPRTGRQPAVAVAEPLEAAATADKPDNSQSKLLKDSGSIAIATLISRITGFGKQLLLLAVLGPAIASSFTSASLIPNMIAELVLGAVLTAIVVPTLVRAEQEDPDHGAAFIRRLVTAAAVILGTAAVLATAAAPVLATHVFVSADGKVNTSLTTALTFLLVPAVLFYGLSALFTAILNTRGAFKPGAWAPVLNNVVVLAVLGLYALTPGEITLDPVRMSDPKLLVLGCGVTLGVIVQATSLLPAIRRQGIDLRPLWGLDNRLKQFGTMAAAIILYVLISQIGGVFANNISSRADEAGPAIYQNAWLLLQLPYGVIGVTLLTAIMPRLSRNAANDDTPAVVDDLSAATRLTMIALIPIVTFLTFAGPQVGDALFGYARFAEDASRLGTAVSFSAFTLIPYSLVLIHLRVFYAREQAWTPTWIILGITAVKILFSALAPLIADSPDQVVIVLGIATGLGFTVGAVIGGWLLHRSLGDLRMANVGRTVSRVLLSSLAGGAVMLIADRVMGLDRLTESLGGPGSFIRVGITAIVMFAVAFGLMRLAGIPEVVAITVAISRRLGITPPAPPLDLDEPVEEEHTTRIMRRPDPYLAYSGFDSAMDAQSTMVLPVIRPDSVDRTAGGQFPYPVRQTGTSDRPAEFAAYQGEGGPRVSDDAVGKVPAADPARNPASGRLSTDVPPEQSEPGEARTQRVDTGSADSAHPPEQAPGSGPQYDDAAAGPPDDADEHLSEERVQRTGATVSATDPVYDTGMIAVPPMTQASRVQRGPKLIAGASVAGGRYRLLADHGGARGLKFWQALDIKLDREVALTFVDADQRAGSDSGQDGPQAILSRTLRLGRINSPGLARVLDVVRGSSGGIVVAEWTPGRSLREMAETVPSPIGAARAIRVLASATEMAHRSGGALSIDHPDRIRISANGDAVLAFPGTLGDADPQSDVRGLGAMLYALITARWPLRTGGVSGNAATVGGLRLADFGSDGTPVEPRQIRPEVPFEISAVAVRSLEPNKGVRTAATIQHVLEQASVVDQKTDFIPVLRLGQRAPAPADESLADPELLAAEREKSQRMMWIMVALGILTALVVGIVIWWLVSVFAPGDSSEPLNEQRVIGLTTSRAPEESPSSAAPSTTPADVAGVPVPISGITVFSPEGTPDDPDGGPAAMDGDPATSWSTDQYFQQFPALKKGVGLLATLPSPANLTKVTITSPTPGTSIEIRTSPTEAPTLDQTQLAGTAVLGDGITEVPVQSDQAARYVLIWVTGLGNSGAQFQSSIAELSFEAKP